MVCVSSVDQHWFYFEASSLDLYFEVFPALAMLACVCECAVWTPEAEPEPPEPWTRLKLLYNLQTLPGFCSPWALWWCLFRPLMPILHLLLSLTVSPFNSIHISILFYPVLFYSILRKWIQDRLVELIFAPRKRKCRVLVCLSNEAEWVKQRSVSALLLLLLFVFQHAALWPAVIPVWKMSQ